MTEKVVQKTFEQDAEAQQGIGNTTTMEPSATTHQLCKDGGTENATMVPNLHEAALSIASEGMMILPLVPGAKTPLTARGLYDATNKLKDINDWWWENPSANIGIRTGNASGIIVIDVKGGAIGMESLAIIEAEHGALVTQRATTPWGGIQLYFNAPTCRVPSRTNVLPGIDVRGDDGYIVAPPSVVDGNVYEWIEDDTLIADLPESLLSVLTEEMEVITDQGDVETEMPVADQLLAIIGNTMDLFHSRNGRSFANVRSNDRDEIYEIGSERFELLLTRRYYVAIGKTLSQNALDTVVWNLKAAALIDGRQQGVPSSCRKRGRREMETSFEDSPVGKAIISLMRHYERWEGTAEELFKLLPLHVPSEVTQMDAWPKRSNWLSFRIDRLVLDLESIGITVSRQKYSKKRIIILSCSDNAMHGTEIGSVTSVT